MATIAKVSIQAWTDASLISNINGLEAEEEADNTRLIPLQKHALRGNLDIELYSSSIAEGKVGCAQRLHLLDIPASCPFDQA